MIQRDAVLQIYKSTTVTLFFSLPVFPYITAAFTIKPPLLDPGPAMIHFHNKLLTPYFTMLSASSHLLLGIKSQNGPLAGLDIKAS